MRSRPSRRAGKRATRRNLVSGGLVGVVFAISLTLVPVAFNSNLKGGAKPVVAEPVAIPARPVVGKPFTVSFKVTRSDTGTPFLRGRMSGDPSIAGRVVQHTESFRGGTARVALVVPTNTAGKTLKVTVAIKDGTTSATRVATFRVQGPPSVSIGDASVTEGNTGTTTMSFPVTLSAASAQPVSVTYATADKTATTPSDYATTSGTLTFNPGEKSKTVSVGVVADTAIEQDEAFSITISGSVGATIAVGTATGTITNDDTQVPITPGAYKGLIDGNFLFLDVVDRYVTHFRSNYIRMDCGSSGYYVYGSLDWGDSQFAVGPDGTFKVSADSNGTVSGLPAKYHDEITGRLDGTNASGTVLGSVEYDRDGVHLSCTSGPRPWTASLQR
jgi:Calx-beta domain